MDTLLNQLKEQDLELYQEIVADLLPSSDHRNNFIICGKLQEAIRARGWCYRTRYIDWVWVDIFDACDETLGEAECYTEAEALLIAYLAAI